MLIESKHVLTRKTLDALEFAAHQARYGMLAMSGGSLRKRDFDRICSLGFARDVGPVPVCDGNGFELQPQRLRSAYKLTDEGRELVKFYEALQALGHGLWSIGYGWREEDIF